MKKARTSRLVSRALMMGVLEAAANEEYRKGRYHPEKGGPALAVLNRFRKDKRLTKRPRDLP